MARQTGNFGAVYVKVGLSFVKILDVYDWKFDLGTKVYDASIKMDTIERWAPSHNTGVKFTAKRYSEGVSVFPFYVADSAQNGTQTTWRLDLIDSNGSFTQITVNGYAVASNSNAPQNEGSEETFELQVDDSFVYSN